MAAPMKAGLPPDFILENGFLIRVTALDPTTGAVNTSVVVSDVSIAADTSTATTGVDGPAPSPLLVPTMG